MTAILQGTVDTLTATLLHQPIAQARAGCGRLVVIDDGAGLADRFDDWATPHRIAVQKPATSPHQTTTKGEYQ